MIYSTCWQTALKDSIHNSDKLATYIYNIDNFELLKAFTLKCGKCESACGKGNNLFKQASQQNASSASWNEINKIEEIYLSTVGEFQPDNSFMCVKQIDKLIIIFDWMLIPCK